MIKSFLVDTPQQPKPEEGLLYRCVTIYGHTFPLYYGYYEECDRINPEVDPMPIYPDFLKEPRFTEQGHPFVTKMQDACPYYRGKAGKCRECADCKYYQHGDDLLGICLCPKHQSN